MLKIFLSLVLFFFSGTTGIQATLTSGNVSSVAALNPDYVQLDNVHLPGSPYGDESAYQARLYQASLVDFADKMVILYVEPSYSLNDFVAFCSRAAGDIDATLWQVGQEVDIAGGAPGYFGSWGISNLSSYLVFLEGCGDAIRAENPDAKIVVGLSTSGSWGDFLSAFVNAGGDQFVDYVSLHHYNRYPDQMYDAAVLRNNIAFVRSETSVPVIMGEMGLRYLSGDWATFQAEQADFIRVAMTDAIFAGAEKVFYYGFNPSWDGVDIKNNPAALSEFKRLKEYLYTP